jgi:hypothetical protein
MLGEIESSQFGFLFDTQAHEAVHNLEKDEGDHWSAQKKKE